MPCSASSLAVCSDGGDIAGGAELAAPVGSGLQGAIEGGKREGRRRSSQRCRRGGQRARVGPSSAELTGGELGRWRWKTTAVATLQGLPRCASRRGGRGGRGGSPGHFGGAREARWPWWQWTVATNSARWLRARNRGGGRSVESEKVQGVAWRRGRGPGRREEGGKQEVAGASPALATELLRGEGRKTTGGGTPGGLGRTGAGPAGLPGERQVRFLSSLLFLFLFFFI